MKNTYSILLEHYNKVFKQEPEYIITMLSKPDVAKNDIKTLVYAPSEENNFWKLCTIGTSDYEMPQREIGLGRKANRRNEYVMFVEPSAEISYSTNYWLTLPLVAKYTAHCEKNITVSDTIEFTGGEGESCGAVILMPEVMKKPDIVKCYITKKKFISVFQVMPITRQQLNEKLNRQDGTYWLMEQFYTHDDDYNLIAMKPLANIETPSK